MKIKKGDKVKLIKGKDKGKTGKVLQIFPSKNRASVEGLNLLIKHMRPRKQGESGQRIEFPAAMDMANMMLVCPKCNKATRVGYKYVEAGEGTATSSNKDGQTRKKKRKYRKCIKCDQTIN